MIASVTVFGQLPLGVVDFLEWLVNLNFEYKLLIGGNHDFFAANAPKQFLDLVPKEVTYLCNSGVTINGCHFWGSPYQPDLKGWAFGEDRGAPMRKHWTLIPNHTTVLITHTPPYGILDQSRSGRHLGCEILSERIEQLTLQTHIFGHVHASYGQREVADTLYINASNFNSSKGLVHAPIVFSID